MLNFIDWNLFQLDKEIEVEGTQTYKRIKTIKFTKLSSQEKE